MNLKNNIPNAWKTIKLENYNNVKIDRDNKNDIVKISKTIC